jgi:hypothetical protein
MQLRHHPQMWYGGAYSWPPVWHKISGPGLNTLDDESATLVSTTLSRIDPPTACHLTVVLNGSSYIGMAQTDDSSFCRRLCAFLQNHIGKSIKEIGDLDLA